jgi:hypothetical protein
MLRRQSMHIAFARGVNEIDVILLRRLSSPSFTGTIQYVG